MTTRQTRLALLLAAAVSGCANLGRYTWVDDLPEASVPPDSGYVLGPGDVIQVRVYNQEGMSARAKVRPDGKVSIPFLNDVTVAGYTPSTLSQQLQTRLREFVNLAVVTVSLEETKPLAISVLGEVPRQGVLQVEGGTGLLQIIALAGGLTEFAHKDRIFVVRQGSPAERIRFSYEKLSHSEGRGPRFRLQAGDVVMVE